MNRVGIDIGSTTVKIAILDDDDQIIFSAYERHFANIQETLKNIINDAYDTLGEREILPADWQSLTIWIFPLYRRLSVLLQH